MFRASSAHLQEVNDVNCTCMQPLVFSFCKSELLYLEYVIIMMTCSKYNRAIIHFYRMRIPEAAYMYN